MIEGFLRKYWNPICTAIILGMVVLIAISSLLLFDPDTAQSEKALTFMAAHMTGMIVCCILFLSTLLDQRIGKATFFFMCLISMEFLNLFLEFLYWHAFTEGYPDSEIFSIYIIENITYTFIVFLFGNYVKCILNMSESAYKHTKMALLALMAVECILMAINYLTHWFFDVSGGSMEWDTLMPVVFLPPVAMMIVCIVATLRHSSDRRHKIFLIGYFVIPVASIALTAPEFSSSVLYLATLVSFIFMYGGVYLDRGIKLVKNEAAMMDQKVALLVSSIEPEFLEETLDSIASVEGTPEETVEAVMMFKKYFRENIDTISHKKPIHINKELEHVSTYLKLEKLRFKDKLNVQMNIRDRNFYIPAMTLQMITENAIKHGITQREQGGTVVITTEELEGAHRIVVKDDGVGFDVNKPRDPSRSHIGMENLVARLEEMVGGTFVIESTPGVGTIATVTIPKR